MAVINQPEKKLSKRTSVQWLEEVTISTGVLTLLRWFYGMILGGLSLDF